VKTGLFMMLLLASSASAQSIWEVSGIVTLDGTRDGLPGVAVDLCEQTNKDITTTQTLTTGPLPTRGQVREILITGPNAPPVVTAVMKECRDSRTIDTDDSGRFRFPNVSTGTYQLSFHRNGYIGREERGRYPDVVTKILAVGMGSAPEEIPVALIKAGSLSGSVRDERGRPLPLMDVQAVFTSTGGPRVLMNQQTNDRGEYRLFGLPPGEFHVSATPPQSSTDRSYRMTFHPDAVNIDDAKTIRIRAGEEVSAIDIVMKPAAPLR
jgi:hypothetical protein